MDARRRHIEFKVGDRVLLSTADLKLATQGTSKKLQPKFTGPFKITAKVGANAYTLELPRQLSKMHPTVNVSRLRPYKDNDQATFPTREKLNRPPPQLVDEDDGYEVERIVDKMRTHKGRQFITWYLVKWKGYPDSDNTWRKAEWSRPPHAGTEVWDFVTAYDSANPGLGRLESQEPTF